MNKKVLAWMHERQAAIQQARAMLDEIEKAGRAFTDDEEQRYADLLSKADGLDEKIKREQELDAREASMGQAATRASKPGAPEDANIGMSDGDVRRYSLVRAVMAMATGNWRDAQLELEASQAVAKRLGFEPQGLFVPYDWQRSRSEQRDLTKGTATAGGHTIATNLLVNDFIELLRNRMVVQQAGATMLTGLVGDIAIPRQTGGATAYWVAESGAPTESQQAFDQVPMSPKTVGAFVDMSRKLLKQSSLDVEAFVRNDLARILGLEIDRAALHGSGSSNQPLGIAGTVGIGAVYAGGAASNATNANGAAPVWTDIVNLEKEVAVDNADIGSLAYITNARLRGKMKTTVKVASTDSIMLWENNDAPVNGYRSMVSNQVAGNLVKGASGATLSAMFFGNWADLIMAMWGTLDLMVDPYTGGTSGTVRVIALQDVDIAVRHSESFAAGLDFVTN